MKYYISEYWEMMNSDDPDIRDKGDATWLEKAKQYALYFDGIKDKLPKGFLKTFTQNDRFHDFILTAVNLVNIREYSSSVEFQIRKGSATYRLKFAGVKRFLVNIPTTQNWLGGMLTWGYSEFELNDDNLWVIRILCDFDCEIEILFKRISVTKVK